MNWKLLVLTGCLVTGGQQMLQAQAAPKIATVNIGNALAGTAEGKQATARLSAKIEPQQRDFDTRQHDLASLTDQLNKGANALSDEKKREMARDIEEKKKRLERDMQDADENLRGEQQRLLQSMGQRLTAVITKYAKDNGYSLVLESGGNSSVLYAAPTIDITADVISLYDKTYPASAAVTRP